jgi:hypothetical protein
VATGIMVTKPLSSVIPQPAVEIAVCYSSLEDR